jgi:predicted nucleotidyltransferase
MNKNNFLTEKEKMAVKRFSSRLKSELGNDLMLVKLIGSKAKGDFSSESDIDIWLEDGKEKIGPGTNTFSKEVCR